MNNIRTVMKEQQLHSVCARNNNDALRNDLTNNLHEHHTHIHCTVNNFNVNVHTNACRCTDSVQIFAQTGSNCCLKNFTNKRRCLSKNFCENNERAIFMAWFVPNLTPILLIFLMLQSIKQSGSTFFGLPSRYITDISQLESLETRRNNLSRSFFFQDICKPTSCLHYLIPPPRDTSVTARLRLTTSLSRPNLRTKEYCSFINFDLHHYQPTQWLLTHSTHLSQHLCTYMRIVCFVCCFCLLFQLHIICYRALRPQGCY